MQEKETVEKSVFQEIPTEKIYTEKAIKIATFCGGTLVAGYCIAENFKAFNDYKSARKTWFITIGVTIFILLLVFFLLENIRIPNIVFPLLYAYSASYFIKHYQGKKINEHLQNGGEIFSGWRTTLITLISLTVLVVIIFSLSYMFEYIYN